MSAQCFNCNNELFVATNADIARSEECPKCYSNLRCCKMCAFFDTNSYNECRESTADRIVEKEKANFCDYFKLGDTNRDPLKEKDQLLSLADSLFKK